MFADSVSTRSDMTDDEEVTMNGFVCVLRAQVREPLQPRQPGGIDAPPLRAHGSAGWILELRPVQVFQGPTVAAVHPHDSPAVPLDVLHGLPLAEPHVAEISFYSGNVM